MIAIEFDEFWIKICHLFKEHSPRKCDKPWKKINETKLLKMKKKCKKTNLVFAYAQNSIIIISGPHDHIDAKQETIG